MKKNGKMSYSQSGEDMIVSFLFEVKGITQPTYMDIGAHDPYLFSNTAHFYERGCRGVNIEPNPDLFQNIKKSRKKDINLNIGIGDQEGILDFYVMNAPTMSTFSKENADELVQKFGFVVEKTIQVDVQRLDKVVKEYCNGVFPDYLSLDTEGLDLIILQTIDYEQSCPKVICVETVEYSENLDGKKETDIISFLESKGYRKFADTYVNTIFIKF